MKRYNADYRALVRAIDKALIVARESLNMHSNLETIDYIEYLLTHYLNTNNVKFVECRQALQEENKSNA
jgi:hypothetical protein